jgi:transposase-like protein
VSGPVPEATARTQGRQVIDGFRQRWLRLADVLDAAETEVLAHLAFPPEHWRQIWRTHPLERLNQEVKRRADGVGIFPTAAAGGRLPGAILSEQHAAWPAGRRSFSVESRAKRSAPLPELAPLLAAS